MRAKYTELSEACLQLIQIMIHYIIAGRCMAVDREFAYVPLCVYSFVICCSTLGVFGVHFAPPRVIWKPLGSLWAALGPLWGALGCHGGRLGLPRGIGGFFTK